MTETPTRKPRSDRGVPRAPRLCAGCTRYAASDDAVGVCLRDNRTTQHDATCAEWRRRRPSRGNGVAARALDLPPSEAVAALRIVAGLRDEAGRLAAVVADSERGVVAGVAAARERVAALMMERT